MIVKRIEEVNLDLEKIEGVDLSEKIDNFLDKRRSKSNEIEKSADSRYERIKQIFRNMSTKTKEEKLKVIEKHPHFFFKGVGEAFEKNIESFSKTIEILDRVFPGQWDISFEQLINIKNPNPVVKLEYYRLRTIWKSEDGGEDYINSAFTDGYRFVPGVINILILFPEIKIENSRRYKHTIKDLLVCITFDTSYDKEEQEVFVHSIHGTRLTASSREITSKYGHSHLSSMEYESSKINFNDFCKGNTPFARLVNHNREDAYRNRKSFHRKLELLFLSLKEYLVWESIEGVPYKYIHQMAGTESIRILPTKVKEDFYNDLMSRVNETKLNFTLSKDNRRVIVKDDEQFDKFLKAGRTKAEEFRTDCLALKNSKGEYSAYTNSTLDKIPNDIFNRTRKTIWFNGREIPFKAYQSEEALDPSIFYIHPKVKQYVKHKIESKILTSLITRDKIKQ